MVKKISINRTSKILSWIFSILLLALALTNGCSGAQTENIEPVELVEVYYKSLQAKDYKKAKACLSDEFAAEQEKYVDTDEKNLRRLSDLKIKKGADVGIDVAMGNKYFKQTQVVAEYDAEYLKEITSANGKQIRFIYVGKKNRSSPWKIISIGTGP